MIGSNYYLHCSASERWANVQSIRGLCALYKEWTVSFVFQTLTNAYDNLHRRHTLHNGRRSNFEFIALSLFPCRTRRNVSFESSVHNELLPTRSIQLHIVRVSNRCDAERPNNSITLTMRYRHTIHRLVAWMRMNLFLSDCDNDLIVAVSNTLRAEPAE